MLFILWKITLTFDQNDMKTLGNLEIYTYLYLMYFNSEYCTRNGAYDRIFEVT